MKTALFDVTWKSGLVKGEDYGSSEYFLVFSSGGSNASNCRHTFISQAFKEISLSRLPDLAQIHTRQVISKAGVGQPLMSILAMWFWLRSSVASSSVATSTSLLFVSFV